MSLDPRTAQRMDDETLVSLLTSWNAELVMEGKIHGADLVQRVRHRIEHLEKENAELRSVKWAVEAIKNGLQR
jgi:hypothetical protein